MAGRAAVRAMADAKFLREQAARCRRLAAMVSNPDVIETLLAMARDHDSRANSVEAGSGPESKED